MSNKKKIYLASPLGFYESGRIFLYEHLIPLVESLNLEVIDPWRLTAESEIKKVSSISDCAERKIQWERLNLVIGENNKKGIELSDGLLAVLDGSDVDSGTASEIGFAYGIGKKITAYRSDFRLSSDNEGSVVNLQVEYFIKKSGGKIATSLQSLREELIRSFISSSP